MSDQELWFPEGVRKSQPKSNKDLGLAFVLNFLILIVLFGVMYTTEQLKSVFPCCPQFAKAICLPIICLLVIHILVRLLFHNTMNDLENISVSGFSIKDLRPLLALLHPRIVPDSRFYLASAVGIVISTFALLIIPSVEKNIQPSIKSFTVIYSDTGENIPLTMAEAFENSLPVNDGEKISVKAEIEGDNSVSCNWSSSLKGNLSTVNGCATSYTPPPQGERDVIVVRVYSRCRNREAVATLSINILRP